MSPAVSAGDHVVMEKVTFLFRKPHRGDIVAFKTDGITSLQPGKLSFPPGTFYVKRIAGEPGEHLQILDRQLFINGNRIVISNSAGAISYTSPVPSDLFIIQTEHAIGADAYFVLGDNSTNSLDSRYFGAIPGANIAGKMVFCYWPPRRIGFIK